MFNRFSLTTSMLLLTVTVGLAIWIGYDVYQYKALNSILKGNLTERFDTQAREQRLRFDSYVKSYSPGVKLYANSTSLHHYLRDTNWSAPDFKIIEYEQIPSWLPKLSSLRRFVLPRIAMLIDNEENIRELYLYKNTSLPDELVDLSSRSLELSNGQSYLMMTNSGPYLLASEVVKNEFKSAYLLIASPVDEAFLRASQGVSDHDGIIALLREDENKILVSSNEELVPAGAALHELERSYLLAGEGFFGSGSSDIIVRFKSFVSTREVKSQTEAILHKDRQIRAITAITFIIAFGIAMYWITSRIQKLSRKVVEFSDEMHMPQPELHHKDELLELENRFELLAQAVQFETRALEHETLHDLLTSLPNRKLLYDRLLNEISNCKRSKGKFVLMLCDLNDFKAVNDTFGHHAGDNVLKQASKRLLASLRKDDTVARFGGDEFSLLLSGASINEARIIAQKIIDAFNAPFIIEDAIVKVGISIGIVEYPEHGIDVDSLMKHADVAMYHAKNNQTGYTVYNVLITNNDSALHSSS